MGTIGSSRLLRMSQGLAATSSFDKLRMRNFNYLDSSS